MGQQTSWATATSYEDAPSPHPLAAETPMEDFLAKFVAMRFVVDPGTRQERSYRFAAAELLRLGTTDQFEPGPALPVANFLATLPPLPPGGHHYEAFIEMSAGLRRLRDGAEELHPGRRRSVTDVSLPRQYVLDCRQRVDSRACLGTQTRRLWLPTRPCSALRCRSFARAPG